MHFDAGSDAAARRRSRRRRPTRPAQPTRALTSVDPASTTDSATTTSLAPTTPATRAVGRCLNVPDDTQCQDGVYCDGVELCVPGHGCEPGAVVSCDNGNACHIATCVEATKSCAYAERDVDGDGDPDAHCEPGHDCDDLNPERLQPARRGLHATASTTTATASSTSSRASCPRATTCAGAMAVTAPGTFHVSTVGANDTFAHVVQRDHPHRRTERRRRHHGPRERQRRPPGVGHLLRDRGRGGDRRQLRRRDLRARLRLRARGATASARSRETSLRARTSRSSRRSLRRPSSSRSISSRPRPLPTNVDCASATPVQPGVATTCLDREPADGSAERVPLERRASSRTRSRSPSRRTSASTRPRSSGAARPSSGCARRRARVRPTSSSAASDRSPYTSATCRPGVRRHGRGDLVDRRDPRRRASAPPTMFPPTRRARLRPSSRPTRRSTAICPTTRTPSRTGARRADPTPPTTSRSPSASDVLLIDRFPQTESGARLARRARVRPPSTSLGCDARARRRASASATCPQATTASSSPTSWGSGDACRPWSAPRSRRPSFRRRRGDVRRRPSTRRAAASSLATRRPSVPDYGAGCDAPGQPPGGAPDQVLSLNLAQAAAGRARHGGLGVHDASRRLAGPRLPGYARHERVLRRVRRAAELPRPGAHDRASTGSS